MRFTDAHAPGALCHPSRYGLLTARFPFRADIPPYFFIRNDRIVTPPSDHIATSNRKGWTHYHGEFWREGGMAPDLKLNEVLPHFTDEAVRIIRNHDTVKLDDLEKDPAETTNLFNEHPGTVECLRGELRRIIAAEDSAAR